MLNLDAILAAKVAGGGSGGSGGGAQSDWNAKEGEPGHVLNRTHYKEEQDVELASGNYTSMLIPDYGVFGCPVTYHTQWEYPRPEEFVITFDGVECRGLKPVKVEGLGTLVGNFAMLNALMGTSFANTGEPFLAYVGETHSATVFTTDTTPAAHEITISYVASVYKKLEKGYLPEPIEINFVNMGLPVIPSDGTPVEVDITYKEQEKYFQPFILNNVVKLVFNYHSELGNDDRQATAIAMPSHYADSLYYYFQCFVDGAMYFIEVTNKIVAWAKSIYN